jgi:hypothetical protein
MNLGVFLFRVSGVCATAPVRMRHQFKITKVHPYAGMLQPISTRILEGSILIVGKMSVVLRVQWCYQFSHNTTDSCSLN